MDCTVIAWIWARTVTCPNPACAGTMPLVNRSGSERRRARNATSSRFPTASASDSRSAARRRPARWNCRSHWSGPACCAARRYRWPTSAMKARPGVWARNSWRSPQKAHASATTSRPTEEHEKAADVPRPDDVPEAEIAVQSAVLDGPELWDANMGRPIHKPPTNRPDYLQRSGSRGARSRILADGAEPGYADAVATYLAFASQQGSRATHPHLRVDDSPKEGTAHTFVRSAIPMIWDYAEGNQFGPGAGNIASGADWIAKVIEALPRPRAGSAVQV